MSNAHDRQTIIYLEPDQKETLLALARRLRVNRSAVMRRALDELAERIFVSDVATDSRDRLEQAEQAA